MSLIAMNIPSFTFTGGDLAFLAIVCTLTCILITECLTCLDRKYNHLSDVVNNFNRACLGKIERSK